MPNPTPLLKLLKESKEIFLSSISTQKQQHEDKNCKLLRTENCKVAVRKAEIKPSIFREPMEISGIETWVPNGGKKI